jgi:hypothetical protein
MNEEAKSRIALITYAAAPGLTPDDRLVLEPLGCRGLGAEPVRWDDPAVDWTAFDAFVLRSCWDYHLRLSEFLAWLERIASQRLWNPPALVRWNADKRYLLDLESRGVRIVPTLGLDRGDSVQLAEAMRARGWLRAVVKPSVSANAYETWDVSASGAPAEQARLEALLGKGAVLLQRFQEEVAAEGEWSLVFLGGAYSHAVLKRPRAGEFRVQEAFGGAWHRAIPPRSLVGQAEAVLGAIEGPWLYARVDGLRVDGRLLLMELELIEPTLFLAGGAGAPERFAEAIAACLASR